MRLFTLFAAAVLGFSAMCAADPVEIKLWEEIPAPTDNGIAIDAENNSNLDWITGVSTPTVTVYPADTPNGIALLMCPGGAYAGLAFKHEGIDLAKDLNEQGVTLAVLKYRMPNGHHEVPADDARRAIEILRENAGKWGINPGRIGIGGASAGGHLASTVATHPKDSLSALDFQVLLYPVITMREGVTHQGSRDNLLGNTPDPALVDEYCNELHVSEATPKAFIVLSADDDVVPMRNSMDYYNALLNNNIPTSFHIYPTGGHGWSCRPSFPYQDAWVKELLTWLGNIYK